MGKRGVWRPPRGARQTVRGAAPPASTLPATTTHSAQAVNFWCGTSRSTTSFHRDHYENLYAVVAGAKAFTLLPPSDAWRMKLKNYPVATYQTSGGAAELEHTPLAHLPKLQLQPVLHSPPERVLWSSVQPDQHEGIACAECPGLEPLRVTVSAGEVLYLPAMWWHQVGRRLPCA